MKDGRWLIWFILGLFLGLFLNAFLCKSILEAQDISKPLSTEYDKNELDQRFKDISQFLLRYERTRTVYDVFPSGQRWDTLISPVRFDTVTNVFCSCNDTARNNAYHYIEQLNDTLIVIGKNDDSADDTIRCTIIGIIGGF